MAESTTTLPLHLAEIIEDEMRERKWKLADLIKKMGPFPNKESYGICHLSWEMFLAVRRPDVMLGDVMAEQLAKAFGVDATFLTRLHEDWRKAQPALETEATTVA